MTQRPPIKEIDANNLANYLVYQLTQGGYDKTIHCYIEDVPGSKDLKTLCICTNEAVKVLGIDPLTNKPTAHLTIEQIDHFLNPVMDRIAKDFPSTDFAMATNIRMEEPKNIDGIMPRIKKTLENIRDFMAPKSSSHHRL